MDLWEPNEQDLHTWDSFPSYPVPTMQNAAHPVTTEVPPGYNGTTSWLKYSDAVEEWCDLTKFEPKRRGPAIAPDLTYQVELRLVKYEIATQKTVDAWLNLKEPRQDPALLQKSLQRLLDSATGRQDNDFERRQGRHMSEHLKV